MEQGKITIHVDRSGIDKRLDVFLAQTHPNLASRSHIKRLIDDKCVLVNGLPSKPHHRLKNGDTVEISLLREKRQETCIAEDIPLDVFYEDGHLLVINKPAGMAVHPAAGINSGTLVNALLHRSERLSNIGPRDRPGIVHRLDKDTSGIMVAAKDDETHRELARQFKERTVKKRYIAFVKGIVELDKGLIELPVGRHPTQRQKQAVRFSESREAVTEYKVVSRFKGYTLLELTPKTGRMHQLRVHLAYIGHPILGDRQYGQGSDLISRQALHASMLGFIHPDTKKYMEFNSEMPTDMQKLHDFLLASV